MSSNLATNGDGSQPLAALPSAAIDNMSFSELTDRREQVAARLNVMGGTDHAAAAKKKRATNTKPSRSTRNKPANEASSSSSSSLTVSYTPKVDTHWDFLMKEMMWLAADFSSERKRQLSLAKKLSTGVRQFHKTKETRRKRELAEAELKRRRLAGRIGREVVRGFWTKIERVIAYKQKLEADVERRRAMNKQLVALVKQTERYGETLVKQSDHMEESDETDSQASNNDMDTDESENHDEYHRRRKRRKQTRLTIEEALAMGDKQGVRRTKNILTDYSRVDVSDYDAKFYGETTTSDSGSDGSFVPESESPDDDETTLREAEASELRERKERHESDEDDDVTVSSYAPDPNELRKLHEETEMDINQVLQRLRTESQGSVDIGSASSEGESQARRVTFAADVQAEASRSPRTRQQVLKDATGRRSTGRTPKSDPGNDADDDADASDVEDFVDDDDEEHGLDGSDEFEADINEVDDETTIEAEERLGREMSADEEISLLKRESEMSIEELRKKYAVMDQEMQEEDSHDDASVDGDSGDATSADDDAGSEDEFRPPRIAEVDDETTIEAEERMGREMSHEQEIALLQRENEIPIEELRAMYSAISSNGESRSDSDVESEGNSENRDVARMLERGENDDGDVDEFRPEETVEVDDESTMEAEEALGRDMTYEEELKLLIRESEISVDELRRMYSLPDTSRDDELQGSSLTSSMFEADDYREEDEFEPDTEMVDDESTISAEERLGREIGAEEEIALLKRESETPIEELRKTFSLLNQDSELQFSDQEADVKESVDEDDRSKRRRIGTDAEQENDEGLAALKALQASELRARTTLASRPFLISKWVKLREYQQTGLNWLVSVQTRRLNAILADEMGLGKTLQTIALLAYLAAYKGIWGPHLIVVPTSCIVNWETEFKRFCPGLKVLCYYGSAKRRKELRQGWTKSNWHHVIITSYQLVVQDSFAFKRKKYYYLILDEAHNIKNFESQRWQTLVNFNTQRRLLLTGTPLQNNLMELWSLLHFLMPHVFRSRKEFSYWFSNPMNSMIEGNSSRSDELIARLHGIIRPFVLRRLKRDVETQLPGKFEHVLKCQLSRRQMFLYEEFMARSSTRQALRKGGNFVGMMNVLMQLRKVCNHPDLFEPRSVVTPFVVEPLGLRVPGCVLDLLKPQNFCQSVSLPTVSSLWTAASGDIRPPESIDFDSIRAEQLKRLEPSESLFRSRIDAVDSEEPDPDMDAAPGLSALLRQVREACLKDKQTSMEFQMMLNSRRCRSCPFPYPMLLQKTVEMEELPLHRSSPELVSRGRVLSTPASLLAMRRTQQERADDLDDMLKKFVFCVPKAGAVRPILVSSSQQTASDRLDSDIHSMLTEPIEEYMRPFQRVHARLSSFFPDKKLVQFDAGKLQTLAKLLRHLKSGGHRALIFTQMSKMLDILEAFLNLNGHTYLRLDGATGVERRQRLMDRFNNDPRVFCFILSTRSGGLGINLTGADTVLFYDSDWNPAMDAQAQDRAHRIGQTRDVHIYRLITEHSVEENILLKAQQKRNLDILVMDEGKFDALDPSRTEKVEEDQVSDVYTKGGLRNILGIAEDDDVSDEDPQEHLSKEQMEKTMTALEDEEDVLAMRGAQKEAEEELQEFDESIEIKRDDDSSGEEDTEAAGEAKISEGDPAKQEQSAAETSELAESDGKQEEDMEMEFAAWQSKVGLDASAIEASLSPTERYALRFREDVDPYYSIFAIMEQKRKMEATEVHDEEIDIDELERTKAAEERRALREGDLLGTQPRPEELVRQKHLYLREKARLLSNKRRRKLTGENWETRVDGLTKHLFWYNIDTGEATWDKPQVLVDLEADELAHKNQWNAMPLKPLVCIMEYLVPFPERLRCSTVCLQWRVAATDISFVRHVLPLEMGSVTKDDRQLDHNHYRTIAEALAIALPGDTIELGDGHYWIEESGLSVDFPLRIIGDEHDPSHVVVELSGTIRWKGGGGWIEGVTFRRPRISTEKQPAAAILSLEENGRLDMTQCVMNNQGNGGSVAIVTGPNAKGSWRSTELRGSDAGYGLVLKSSATVNLTKCVLSRNKEFGLVSFNGASFKMVHCLVEWNGAGGLQLRENSRGQCLKSHFFNNSGPLVDKHPGSSCVPCSGNIWKVRSMSSASRSKPPLGFRLEVDNEIPSK